MWVHVRVCKGCVWVDGDSSTVGLKATRSQHDKLKCIHTKRDTHKLTSGPLPSVGIDMLRRRLSPYQDLLLRKGEKSLQHPSCHVCVWFCLQVMKSGVENQDVGLLRDLEDIGHVRVRPGLCVVCVCV